MLYLGDEMLALYICFQFCISSSIDNFFLFQGCMILHIVAARIIQFLVVCSNSHILYATVAYLHITIFNNKYNHKYNKIIYIIKKITSLSYCGYVYYLQKKAKKSKLSIKRFNSIERMQRSIYYLIIDMPYTLFNHFRSFLLSCRNQLNDWL